MHSHLKFEDMNSTERDLYVNTTIARARRMRAEMIGGAVADAWRGLRGVFRRAAQHEALGALTAIRSAAESLRDHPEVGEAQRRRLIDIVLSEEARLERLFGRRRAAG